MEPSNYPYLLETIDLQKAYSVGSQLIPALRGVSIAVRKGDSDMKRAISQALEAIKSDGSFDAIIKKYKFPAEVKNLN